MKEEHKSLLKMCLLLLAIAAILAILYFTKISNRGFIYQQY